MSVDLFSLPSGTAELCGSVLRFTNHEKKGTVIVVFSSFAAKDYGPQAFSYLKHFAIVHSSCDLLFIKDPKNQWYNRGVSGLGASVDECAKALQSITGNYDRSIFFGSSMGAYASLLYAARSYPTHAIALAPQTFLAPPFPRYNRRIHKGEYIDLSLDVWSCQTRRVIITGEEELFDIFQVLRLQKAETLSWHSIPGSHHNVVKYLDDRGMLFEIVRALADNTLEDFIIRLQTLESGSCLSEHDWAKETWLTTDITAAVKSYHNERYTESLAALKRLHSRFPDWLGVKLLLGLAYYKMQHFTEAEFYLDQVEKATIFIDGYQDALLKCRSAAL